MKMLMALFMLTMTALTWAQKNDAHGQLGTLRKKIESRLGPKVNIESLQKTPYAGLVEVVVDGNVAYVDSQAEYLFIGNIIDLEKQRNLTQARMDEVNAIAFNTLPLDTAIKMVKGKGERVMALYEDPNCQFCKQFHQDVLSKIDNMTVYIFLYNMLGSDSVVKAKNIWCSKSPGQALNDWMLHHQPPVTAPENCARLNDKTHDKILATGHHLRITGTPTMIFTDGSRIPGLVDAKGLEEKLMSVAVKSKR